jgi:uncharacterized protein (TIGR04255 family)
MVQTYKRPPITEAVIHLVFGSALSDGDLEKANHNFARLYPRHQPVRNVGVELVMDANPDLRPIARFPKDERGHRCSSDDETQIFLIWPSSVIFSQLAPYPGWEEYFNRFVRDWTLWKRIIGYREITRVGVRYINRIDVPITGPVVEHEDFLKMYPSVPKDLAPAVLSYGIQIQIPYPEIEGRITINSASVPSPLLGYSSFLFDQDLAKEINPPQKDEDIYKLLNDVHKKKNAIFEACITDRARELFNT